MEHRLLERLQVARTVLQLVSQVVTDVREQRHSPWRHLAHLEPQLPLERLRPEFEQLPVEERRLHEEVLEKQPESLPELVEERHESAEQELQKTLKEHPSESWPELERRGPLTDVQVVQLLRQLQ